MTDDSNGIDWELIEAIGQRTGHALCECPRCGDRRLCAYRPKSQPWPACTLCSMDARGRGERALVRYEPNENLHLVRKNPGQPRTKRQLREDGYTPRPLDRRDRPDSTADGEPT